LSVLPELVSTTANFAHVHRSGEVCA